MVYSFSNLFSRPLESGTRTTTNGITVTFTFKFFQLSSKIQEAVFLLPLLSLNSQLAWQNPLVDRFFSWEIKQGLAFGPGLSDSFVSQSPKESHFQGKILIRSYHLSTWSNINLLQNSQ